MGQTLFVMKQTDTLGAISIPRYMADIIKL